MYSKTVILKLNRTNPTIQHHTVLNIWSPSRNVNFFQGFKNCLKALLKKSNQKEQISNVSESICTAREVVEEIPQTSHSYELSQSQFSANVVIIGSGVAGLSAAKHLCENGIDNITVLEASQRPGGRIHSCWFGDTIIELGSAISHPPATNPIIQNAFEDGVLINPPLNQADPSRGLLLRSDGSVIPFPLTFQVYQIFKEIWAQADIIEYEESGGGKESKIQFVGSRIQQEVRNFPSNYQVDAERLFHGLVCIAANRSNHDTSLINSSEFGDFIQLPGNKLKVPLGHFGKINMLFEELSPDTVLFGKSVNKIKWGGVSDVFPRAVVCCEDGDSFPADYVIITLPLGVLKALADCLFCPGLPASKLNAIMKVPTGHTNKIFLEFSKPFWLWKKDFAKITFNAKDMACREGWLKGVSSIQPIRGSYHVMVVTVAGPQAQCMECLSDKDVINDILILLKKLSDGMNIPEPIKVKRSKWSSDPNYYGSYSYMEPGMTSKDFYDLAAPLPEHSDVCEPVLFFAGEATCPVRYGTIAAAQCTGIREAERLLQLIRVREEKLCQQQCAI